MQVFNTEITQYSWRKLRAKLIPEKIIMKFQLCLTSAKLELACQRSINITSKATGFPLPIDRLEFAWGSCSLGQRRFSRETTL